MTPKLDKVSKQKLSSVLSRMEGLFHVSSNTSVYRPQHVCFFHKSMAVLTHVQLLIHSNPGPFSTGLLVRCCFSCVCAVNCKTTNINLDLFPNYCRPLLQLAHVTLNAALDL